MKNYQFLYLIVLFCFFGCENSGNINSNSSSDNKKSKINKEFKTILFIVNNENNILLEFMKCKYINDNNTLIITNFIDNLMSIRKKDSKRISLTFNVLNNFTVSQLVSVKNKCISHVKTKYSDFHGLLEINFMYSSQALQ